MFDSNIKCNKNWIWISMSWISISINIKIDIYGHQINIHFCLWITLVSPPPPPKHTLDLLAALINGLCPQSSALPPVFSPATYAPCGLKPPQGARMAAAIDDGPGGLGPQSL